MVDLKKNLTTQAAFGGVVTMLAVVCLLTSTTVLALPAQVKSNRRPRCASTVSARRSAAGRRGCRRGNDRRAGAGRGERAGGHRHGHQHR